MARKNLDEMADKMEKEIHEGVQEMEGEEEEDRDLVFMRSARTFIEYISYDWDKDEKWQEFKDTHMKGIDAGKEVEAIKREFYKMHIDERLNTGFILNNEDEKARFLDVCKFVGNITSLGQVFK